MKRVPQHRGAVVSILLLVLHAPQALSQGSAGALRSESALSPSTRVDLLARLIQTVHSTSSLDQDSVDRPVPVRNSSLEPKSTTLAIVLSAILPGAGQVYTERYWHIPVIWGFGYHFATQWRKADDLYRDARERFRLSVEKGENRGQGNQQVRYERDFFRDERDLFAFYLAITYLINIVDAYVGASLYNFDVSDDLGGNARWSVRIPLR